MAMLQHHRAAVPRKPFGHMNAAELSALFTRENTGYFPGIQADNDKDAALIIWWSEEGLAQRAAHIPPPPTIAAPANAPFPAVYTLNQLNSMFKFPAVRPAFNQALLEHILTHDDAGNNVGQLKVNSPGSTIVVYDNCEQLQPQLNRLVESCRVLRASHEYSVNAGMVYRVCCVPRGRPPTYSIQTVRLNEFD